MEGTFKTIIEPSTQKFVRIGRLGKKEESKVPQIFIDTATKKGISAESPSFDWEGCELVDIHVKITARMAEIARMAETTRWTIKDNSLHWKEKCLHCRGDIDLPPFPSCTKCNGEGHTIEKVNPDIPMTTKEGMAKVVVETRKLMNELEDALRVEKPNFWEVGFLDNNGAKIYRARMEKWDEAQKFLSSHIFEDELIKEKQELWKRNLNYDYQRCQTL